MYVIYTGTCTYLHNYMYTSLKSHRKSFMLIITYLHVRVCTCICTLINIPI